jgi:hypothetical protein
MKKTRNFIQRMTRSKKPTMRMAEQFKPRRIMAKQTQIQIESFNIQIMKG